MPDNRFGTTLRDERRLRAGPTSVTVAPPPCRRQPPATNVRECLELRMLSLPNVTRPIHIYTLYRIRGPRSRIQPYTTRHAHARIRTPVTVRIVRSRHAARSPAANAAQPCRATPNPNALASQRHAPPHSSPHDICSTPIALHATALPALHGCQHAASRLIARARRGTHELFESVALTTFF